MSFTDEELAAAGAIPEWLDAVGLDDLWNDHWGVILTDEVHEHRVALVRLALAHPERADEALGPGWEVMTGSAAAGRAVFVWCAPLDVGEVEIWVRDGGVALVVGAEQVFELPPEFDAALSRARLISAAWMRIQEQDGAK